MIDIFKVFKRTVSTQLEIKDPLDFTLTKSSTAWDTEDYCHKCFSGLCHEEFMSDICNSCGQFNDLSFSRFKKRTFRKIYTPNGWVTQRRYSDNELCLAGDE